MAVRKLKTKQRGPKCSYCEHRATHRGFGFGWFSCDKHIDQLTEQDRRDSAPDYSDAAFIGGF